MKESDKEIINFYKTKIEPYVAVFILAFLIVGVVVLYQDNNLKKDIAQNCGWGKEDYVCYCEKSVVDNYKIQQGGIDLDVEMVGYNYSESVN